MTRASIYVTPWDDQVSRATVTVSDEPRAFRVTWRGENGARFRAYVYQKPNPIGFHARLPGDAAPKR